MDTDKGKEAEFEKKVTECSSGGFTSEPQYCTEQMVENLGNIPGF